MQQKIATFSPQKKAQIASKSLIHDKTLWVGDISKTVIEDDLLKRFGEIGRVVRIDIKRDNKTGKNLGYAFVEYKVCCNLPKT